MRVDVDDVLTGGAGVLERLEDRTGRSAALGVGAVMWNASEVMPAPATSA